MKTKKAKKRKVRKPLRMGLIEVAKARRDQLLVELASYAHPTWYAGLHLKSTAALRSMLIFYASPKAEHDNGSDTLSPGTLS